MRQVHEKIEELVEKLVEAILETENLPLELVDVEFTKEKDWYLRIYLDKEGGLDLEDCQLVSSRLEDQLDKLDPIAESYYLEVSSPGLDRQLKKDKDFVRHVGEEVEVHTYVPYEGQKKWIGTLVGVKDAGVEIKTNNDNIVIPRDKISVVRLYLDF